MMSVDERRSLVWANLTSGNIFHMHIIQYSQFARVENDKNVVCDNLWRMVIAALESTLNSNVKPRAPKGTTCMPRTTLGTMSRVALLSYVMIWSWLPHTDARLNDLLGNQVQLDGLSDDRTEDGMYRFSFFVNDSLKELSRTDFEGAPKFLDRDQRHFVVGALRNYLDHVGEVYSPPRVTKEAYLQGLKGQIALDLTTGWDFRRKPLR